MKKLLFTFVMMIALVIVAGSAFGQAAGTKTKPYKGGKYSYALGGIKVNETGYAVISFNGSDATIQNVEGIAGAYEEGTHIVVDEGSTFELNFDIAYGANAGNGIIKVIVTDGATDGCSNQITWSIEPVAAPTLDLAISTTSTIICQATTGTTNNLNAADGSTNVINYTIHPTTGAGVGYSYDFTIAATPASFGTYTFAKVSGTGSVTAGGLVTGANDDIVISATWTTTTGLAPTDIVATISASTLHLSVAEGDDDIAGTQINNTATVTVRSTPTIGTFN